MPRTTAKTSTDEAPMIGLVANIGSATPLGVSSGVPENQSDPMVWLFVLLALGLIGEIASRRMRGAS
jgi:hypothetical protein